MPEMLLHATSGGVQAAELLRRRKLAAAFLVALANRSELGKRIVRCGFSGGNTDALYANRTMSSTLLGRIVDRIVLNLPSCRAIRATLPYRIEILRQAVEARGTAGAVSIVSVPCGYSRDVLEAVARTRSELRSAIRILGVDLDPECVSRSSSEAALSGISATFTAGNALAVGDAIRDSRPDIVVSIGIADFMPDDGLRELYAVLRAGMREDGVLMTSSHHPSPRMQRLSADLGMNGHFRPKMQWEALVAGAGFELESSWTEPAGIVTVSSFRPRARA